MVSTTVSFHIIEGETEIHEVWITCSRLVRVGLNLSSLCSVSAHLSFKVLAFKTETNEHTEPESLGARARAGL